jgi:hypothetical protein
MSKLNGACEGAAAETAMFRPVPITEAIMGGRRFCRNPTNGFRGVESVSSGELWEPAGSYQPQVSLTTFAVGLER